MKKFLVEEIYVPYMRRNNMQCNHSCDEGENSIYCKFFGTASKEICKECKYNNRDDIDGKIHE